MRGRVERTDTPERAAQRSHVTLPSSESPPPSRTSALWTVSIIPSAISTSCLRRHICFVKAAVTGPSNFHQFRALAKMAGETALKRRRVGLACDSCRVLKAKVSACHVPAFPYNGSGPDKSITIASVMGNAPPVDAAPAMDMLVVGTRTPTDQVFLRPTGQSCIFCPSMTKSRD